MGTGDTGIWSYSGWSCFTGGVPNLQGVHGSRTTLPILILPASYPKFDEEEGVLGPTLIELFEATFLLRELVIDLADVHGLQQRITVRGVRLADVHKEVFAVL